MEAPKTPSHAYNDLSPETPVVDADLILQHKENIQPLASGRRAAALAGCLTATPKQREHRLAAARRELEEEAELALENDDDPLAAYLRFVEWTVENYPQGASVESGLLELLERSTRAFATDPRYKNDMRYLKLWIQYASHVDYPIKIFSYMDTNEIGTAYALFYEEYCNALERSGRRQEAMEMYGIGIARRAHPIARLQARQRDFSLRMMTAQIEPEYESQQGSDQAAKPGLGERSKSQTRVVKENPPSRSLGKSSSNKGNFSVYTEQEEAAGGNPWPELESRDAQRKENHRSAVPAQGEILPQQVIVPQTPRVQVYVDEESSRTPARISKEDVVFTQSAKKSGIDALKRDPLRNYGKEKPSTSAISNTKPAPPAPPVASTATKAKTSKSLPNVKPNERLQIDISILYLPDGTEINPIERRARDFGIADKKWPTPEQSGEQDKATNAQRNSSKGDHEARVDFDGTKAMSLANTLTGVRDATVTINTKEALMDVYGMYNSPTKSGNIGKTPVPISSRSNIQPAPTPSGAFTPFQDENAGTTKKKSFIAFADEATPGPSKQVEKSRTSAFQTPSSSTKGLSSAKRALGLKAITPSATVLEEDEEGYEVVTPAPLRQRMPVAFTPFSEDQGNVSTRKSPDSATVNNKEQYPSHKEDLFAIDSRPKVSFTPQHQDEEFEEDERSGDSYSEIEENDAAAAESDNMEEDYGEYPQEDARWAPALTPITERTYDFTSNSKYWTTPQEVRDRSVAFQEEEAIMEAERLAAELREENLLEEFEDPQLSRTPSEDNEPEPLICDPYIRKTTAALMAQLPMPTLNRDLRPKKSGQLERLQKFSAQKLRKSAGQNTPRRGEDVYDLVLDGDTYEVRRKLGEGAYGAVFLAEDLAALEREDEDHSGASADVAIKVVKPCMVWESYALDRVHQTLTKEQRRSLISPRRLYIYEDESLHILDYSGHGTLLEAVNKAGDLQVGHGLGKISSSIPGMDEMLAMFFTIELLKTVEALHGAGFIHGDLKIDNCMVRLEDCDKWATQYDPLGGNGWSSKGICLIDFGRTIDTKLFPPGTKFVTDWKMDKRDCLEMREGRPWTYETDYYGLAGIVFCLLYGKYMEMPIIRDGFQKIPAALKRYWRTAIWEKLFDLLLNPNGFGKPLPILGDLKEIREEMEAWLVENSSKTTRPTNLRALITKLERL